MVDTPYTYECLGVFDSSALLPLLVFRLETLLRGISVPEQFL